MVRYWRRDQIVDKTLGCMKEEDNRFRRKDCAAVTLSVVAAWSYYLVGSTSPDLRRPSDGFRFFFISLLWYRWKIGFGCFCLLRLFSIASICTLTGLRWSVIFDIGKFAESDKRFLVRIFPIDHTSRSLEHVAINERIQSRGKSCQWLGMHCEFSALWPDVKIDKPGSKYTVRFLKKSAVLHADSGDLKRTNEEETYSAKGSTMMKPAPSCR